MKAVIIATLNKSSEWWSDEDVSALLPIYSIVDDPEASTEGSFSCTAKIADLGTVHSQSHAGTATKVK